MRPLQWYQKTCRRYPQSLDIPVPVSRVLKIIFSGAHFFFKLVEFFERFTSPSEGAQSRSVHRCFPKGLGLKQQTAGRLWSPEDSRLHITFQS